MFLCGEPRPLPQHPPPPPRRCEGSRCRGGAHRPFPAKIPSIAFLSFTSWSCTERPSSHQRPAQRRAFEVSHAVGVVRPSFLALPWCWGERSRRSPRGKASPLARVPCGGGCLPWGKPAAAACFIPPRRQGACGFVFPWRAGAALRLRGGSNGMAAEAEEGWGGSVSPARLLTRRPVPLSSPVLSLQDVHAGERL